MRHRSATIASWKAADVRELLIRIKDENPNASRSRLFDIFFQRVKEDEEYAYAAADYAFHNSINALERLEKSPVSIAAVRAQREMRNEEIAEAAENIKNQILLLNLEMPNGKRLRYCTFAEIKQYGERYARLAKKGKPNELIGGVLNEAQVREVLQ